MNATGPNQCFPCSPSSHVSYCLSVCLKVARMKHLAIYIKLVRIWMMFQSNALIKVLELCAKNILIISCIVACIVALPGSCC